MLPRGVHSVPALSEFRVGERDLERPLDRIEGDDVAVAEEADGPADGGLRADMADAEATGRAGEAPVGDEGDLVTHALAVEGGRWSRASRACRGPLRALGADMTRTSPGL